MHIPLSLSTGAAILWLALNLSGQAADTSSADSGKGPAQAKEVKIDNFRFLPATLTVAVGTKVTWINKDDTPHVIASRDKEFASGPLDTDETFSHTFTAPGVHEYYCTMHPVMTGKIIVR